MRDLLPRRCLAVSSATLVVALSAADVLAENVVSPATAGRATQASDGHFKFNDRPLTIDGVVGFGTPVGLIGAALQYDLASWFTVGAGAGTNIAGLQLAALTRFRGELAATPERASAIAFGASFSSGPFGQSPEWLNVDHSYSERYLGVGRMSWVGLDAGIELKRRSGFHLLAAGGLAIPLEPDRGHCEDASTGLRVACYDFAPGEKPHVVLAITFMLGFSS